MGFATVTISDESFLLLRTSIAPPFAAQKPQAMQKNSMTILWHRERISILPAPYCPMQTGQDRYPSASASFSLRISKFSGLNSVQPYR